MLIIVVDPILPPTLDVSVLLEDIRALLTFKLETERLVVDKLVLVALVAKRFVVLVVVAVMLSAKRLEM